MAMELRLYFFSWDGFHTVVQYSDSDREADWDSSLSSPSLSPLALQLLALGLGLVFELALVLDIGLIELIEVGVGNWSSDN